MPSIASAASAKRAAVDRHVDDVVGPELRRSAAADGAAPPPPASPGSANTDDSTSASTTPAARPAPESGDAHAHRRDRLL